VTIRKTLESEAAGERSPRARAHAAEPSGDDPRIAALRELLLEHGLADVRIGVAGSRREIAALAAPTNLAGALAELAPAIQALGFNYVALDLAPGEDEG
jgi:hypothetical protein